MKISGIYEIVNKVNGKKYYGSSSDIKDRFSTHKRLLRQNKHTNIHLQSAYNKYGLNNFDFNIVKETDLTNLILREQQYLDECRKNPKLFYNMSYCAEAPMRGYYNEKNPHPMLGKRQSKKFIEKVKKNTPVRKGKDHPMFGKKHRQESLDKMSKSHKKYKPTEEAIRKMKITCIQKHINASSQEFIFSHPDHNQKICRMVDLTYEFNLDNKHVSDICRGVRKSHGGWKCLGKV